MARETTKESSDNPGSRFCTQMLSVDTVFMRRPSGHSALPQISPFYFPSCPKDPADFLHFYPVELGNNSCCSVWNESSCQRLQAVSSIAQSSSTSLTYSAYSILEKTKCHHREHCRLLPLNRPSCTSILSFSCCPLMSETTLFWKDPSLDHEYLLSCKEYKSTTSHRLGRAHSFIQGNTHINYFIHSDSSAPTRLKPF